MTSIAPVSVKNIETQWRCGVKSVFSGEVHSRKRSSSYNCGGCSDEAGRSNVIRCVFIFFRKIVTDFSSRISRGNLFHNCGAATTNDE